MKGLNFILLSSHLTTNLATPCSPQLTSSHCTSSYHLISSHPISSHLISSHLIASYIITSNLIPSLLVPSCIILSYLIPSHLILSRLAHKSSSEFIFWEEQNTQETEREAWGGARAHYRNWKWEVKDFWESLHLIPSRLIPSHPIPSYLISFHRVSSHLISSCLFPSLTIPSHLIPSYLISFHLIPYPVCSIDSCVHGSYHTEALELQVTHYLIFSDHGWSYARSYRLRYLW